MGLERDLHHLLHRHDCVIVPEWGGFITQYRPARLDEARKVVHPPGKDLSFNRGLTRNDGLLADHVARRSGTGFDAANRAIAQEVEGWRAALRDKGRLELAHVGTFYHDQEHNLQFEPDRRVNFLRDAYGLRPVVAVPVDRVRPVPVEPATVPVIPISAPAGRSSGKRTLVRWAAAASLALVVGFAAWWLLREGQGTGERWAWLDPFGPTPRRTYEPPRAITGDVVARAGVFVVPEEGHGVRELPLTVNDSVMVVVDLGRPVAPALPVDCTAVVVPAPRSVPPVAEVARRFHVIGGCFADPENAERFHNDLRAQGFAAERLPLNKGLHPVAYGSFATRREALEALDAVRLTGARSAWLLVR
jgi:hypothetical protein